MKLLTLAAATLAALTLAKPADAMIPVCMYDTVTPPGTGLIYFTTAAGAQYAGDIFTPTVLGPVGNVDGIFVDSTGAGGLYTIDVELWNDFCFLPCGAPDHVETFTVNLPANPGGPAAYIITFPMDCTFTYAPNPGPEVGIAFEVTPPGCGQVAPTLVPAYDNVTPACGVDTNGFTIDLVAPFCCLEPCVNEWWTFDLTWQNANLLVALADCTAPQALRGPFAKQEAMVRKLNRPLKQIKAPLAIANIKK